MKLAISHIIFIGTFFSALGQHSPADSGQESNWLDIVSSQKKQPVYSVVDSYAELANLYYTYDPNKAFLLVDSAEAYVKRTGNDRLLGAIYTLRGNLYSRSHNYLQAIRSYQQAIITYDRFSTSDSRVAYLNIDIGNIFYELRQYNDAIGFYRKSFTIFNNINGSDIWYGKAVALNNIGLSKSRLSQKDSALYYFGQGMNIRKGHNRDDLLLNSLTYITSIYLDEGQLIKADSIISYGLSSYSSDLNDIWYKKLTLQQGQLYLKRGQTQQARSILEQTKDFYLKNSQQFFYPDIYETFAQLEIEDKNFAKASEYAMLGYKDALKQKNFPQAIRFKLICRKINLLQNDKDEALKQGDDILTLKDSLTQLNEGVVQELLDINLSLVQTQQHNKELQSTTDNYSQTIKGQKWMLFGTFLIIICLLILFYYISRLNRKLKQNENAQRELNQRVLAVVNNTDSLIISISEEGGIRLINQSAIEFFKKWIHMEIAAGDNLLQKVPDKYITQMWSGWISKSQTIGSWKEVSQITIDGKTHYFLENFSSISRRNGEYAGLVMVGNDITKEHEFNVQISEQHDVLEKSNKAKERMLSILAHDLKDAIYSARSLSELVLETPEQFPKDELIHLFSLLFKNFDKTKNLLDGLLEWMRTQTGALEAHPQTFNLNHLSNEVIEAFEEKTVAKQIRLSCDVDESFYVKGDREMVKTVIRNLVSNALKYTRPKIGLVEISAEASGTKVIVHVKDNGQGISEANQQKLFNMPGRFSTPGTSNEQGTGFGLSLCKELLHLNKSQLRLRSEEKVGTDFYFTLPLVNKNKTVEEPSA